jgi:hypothetical protein
MKAATSFERRLCFSSPPHFRAYTIARICNADYSCAELSLYRENKKTESKFTADNASWELVTLGVSSSWVMDPSTPSFLRRS